MLYLVFQIKCTNFAFVIELERHIEILLLKCDCVIVPGLGGFVASHVCARFDENDNMFIPPLRTLGFNPKLNVNDSLLAQSYSEAYDISYPEACGRIDSEVSELKQQIYNNGSYCLNGIGTLYLNEDGNLEFTPCEAGILTPDLYSLSSFEMRRDVTAVSVSTKPVKTDSATIIPFAVPDKDLSDRLNTVSDSENGKTLQIRISAIRNFVAAVVAVVLFLVLGTPVNENTDGVRTSTIENGVIQNLISNGYNNIRSRKSLDLTVANRKLNQETAKTTAVKDTKSKSVGISDTDSFYIVLASRVAKKNADEFVHKLVADGLSEARVLVEKNGLVKVVYGNYSSMDEAYSALDKLHDNAVFNDAWVYQVKN